MYHDRRVNAGNLFLPGADNFIFNRSPNNDIDVIGSNEVAGSEISDTTLDNGTQSNHGFVSEASIDRAFTGIFDNGTDGRLVDFHYEFGAGNVYYSSIPLDFYLTNELGEPNNSFANVYAQNVLNFVVNLSDDNKQQVDMPEPSAFGLLGLGLIGLTIRRKRTLK